MANRPYKNSLLRNKMADDGATLWNSGDISVYSTEHVLLVVFPFHTTAYLAANAGKSSLHASSKTTQNAVGAGTANYAIMRSEDIGATTTPAPQLMMAHRRYERRKLTVGTGEGAEVTINNTSIEEGQPVTLNRLDITESERMSYIIM